MLAHAAPRPPGSALKRSKASTGGSTRPVNLYQQIAGTGTGNYCEGKDILFLSPPSRQKNPPGAGPGLQAIKQSKEVLYNSIFDLVQDFTSKTAFKQQDKTLRRCA